MHNKIPTITIRVIVATIFLSVLCLSCETGPDLSNIKSTPTPDPKALAREQELSGVYKISGTNENGGAPYDGTLTVSNLKDEYKFSWQTGRGKYSGVGVQYADAVAVAYSEFSDGAGCGVALYRIGSNGSLTGRIAIIGEDSVGTEQAERTDGTTFAGKYSVRGTRGSGKEYTGTLDIQKDGDGYGLTWRTGATSAGFGIWKGDHAAIGFGGPNCSFAVYSIKPNGDLDGRRGSQRSVSFAFEKGDKQ